MTPDNAVSTIKGQLGNWTSTSIDTWCINEMNAAVRRLQRGPELPWFLYEDTDHASTNLTLPANTERVALPSNFLREAEEMVQSCVYKYEAGLDDVWTPLVKRDYSRIKVENPGVGVTYYYDIIGSYLYARYVPQEALTLRLIYFKKDTEIAAGSTETLWLANAPDLIIAEAGKVIAAQYLKDAEAAERFAARANEERALLMNEIIARNEANYMREMGD